MILLAVNTYITLDLLKPTPTIIDLSNNFNGRVGDSESYLKLWLKGNGLPYDLTSKDVYFSGIDPKGTPKKIYGTAKADQTGDDMQAGKVSFYFPAGTFQIEGDWDKESTYFGVSDENGTVISTVNVGIHALANKVDMNVNSEPFYTQLDQIISDSKTKINEALSDILNPNSNLNIGLAAAQKALDVIKAQIGTYDNFAFKQITTNSTPSTYLASYNDGSTYQYAAGSVIGLTGAMYVIVTYVPSSTLNEAAPVQTAIEASPGATPNRWIRVAKDANSWGAWSQMTNW